jgi:tRNA(Ile)-lysidine synthetase-like protein
VAFGAAVRRYVQAHHLANEGQPILVACSGGADSVALLHVLHALGHPVAAAHVNYCLRGADSEADEQLVRELAARLGVPAAVHRQSPKELAAAEGLSVQVAARRIRYRFFKDELARLGWNRLATGHHRGDQAETVLLHLLRGRSVEVLRGIPVRRGPVIRPLLFAAKAQLIDYLVAEGLPWREDRSNRDPRYLRNRIRHEVLPALAAINPRIEAHLAERAEAYRQQFEALTGGRPPRRLLEGAVAFRDPSFVFIDEIEYKNNFLNFNKLKFDLFFQYILEKEYRMRPTDAGWWMRRLVRGSKRGRAGGGARRTGFGWRHL